MFASSARVWKVIPAQLQTGVVQDLRSRRICLPIALIQNIHTDLRYVCQQCTCLKDDPSTTPLFSSEHELHTHTEQLRKESSDKHTHGCAYYVLFRVLHFAWCSPILSWPRIRGAFFAWRAPILSWPRIMCSQVHMLKILEPSREMP